MALSAVEQDQRSPEGNMWGLNLSFSGFCGLAIVAYRSAIQMEPENSPAHIALGRCLREELRLEEAIEVLSEYSCVNPDDPKGLYELRLDISRFTSRA